jgi:lipopolysaccharide/colanic/teichoic acid biosynthesis glycosyltransferase
MGMLDDFAKRTFDIVASSLSLPFLSPAILLIAILVKLFSPGPVFYRGLRIGRQGVPFKVFKFRTMVSNAEKIGGPSTADDDPRITGIGRFLRKYKLDELPQLINVLKGEMSLVGPRPEVPHYVNMLTKEERAILSVRPGITDWASICNSDEGAVLAGSPDPEKAYMEKIRPEKIRLQLKYVRERSFFVDLEIIFKTLRTIIPS